MSWPSSPVRHHSSASLSEADATDPVARKSQKARIPPYSTSLEDVFQTKRALVNETLCKVQESTKKCENKLLALRTLRSRTKLGFQPAIDNMLLDEQRLKDEVDRRRAITEKLIMNKIESMTSEVAQFQKIMEQQLVGLRSCEEIIRNVLLLEKGEVASRRSTRCCCCCCCCCCC